MNHCPNPRCLSDDVEIDLIERPRMRDLYQGYCGGCGVRGPIKDDYEEAEAAWDELPRGGRAPLSVEVFPDRPRSTDDQPSRLTEI